MEGTVFEDLKEEHRKDSGLTREDVERLSVDENLSDLERIQLFLSSNAHQLQQSCALEGLPTTFHNYGVAAYDALFPALAISMEQFSSHIQVSAGKAFALIMQDQDLPKDMAMWLLPMTLHMVNDDPTNEVLQAWLDVLCLMVPKLPLKVVREDLLQLALARGKVEETASSRVVCGRLLGAIAKILDSEEIEHCFLIKAMALCQDTDAEVRICLCNQLNAIAHAVGIEAAKDEQRKLEEMLQKIKIDGNRKCALAIMSPLGGASESEGGARKLMKSGCATEKTSSVSSVRSPAIAKLKSTVNQITSLHISHSSQTNVSQNLAKLMGASPATSTCVANLSRSPSIVRTQTASITSMLPKTVNLEQQQHHHHGIMNSLAQSSTIKSTVPANVASASTESSEQKQPSSPAAAAGTPSTMGSTLKAAPKAGIRTARKST